MKAIPTDATQADKRAQGASPVQRREGDSNGRERPSAKLGPYAVIALQRRAGNAAVARLMAQQSSASRQSASSAPTNGSADSSSATAAKDTAGPAGNSAVAVPQLLARPGGAGSLGVQRLVDGGGACPAPPVAPEVPNPKADPKFVAVESKARGTAKDLKQHPSGKSEAKKAQDAAVPPGDDKASQAKAAQADEMAAAKPKGFDKAAFVAAVKKAIAKAAPQNLDEADKFGSSGKADAVKGEVMGKVTEGKEGSAKDVAEKTKQAPDLSVAKDKPVTALKEQPPKQPRPVDGGKAMPDKAPAEQTDLRAGPCEVKAKMADAEVTEEHLEKSNEPQMQDAAKAKKEAEAHAAQAPDQIRQKEEQVLKQQTGAAQGNAQAAVAAMAGGQRGATGQVAARKSAAKEKEEAERAKVSKDINAIYDKTKTEVEAILTGLDAKVTTEFEKGEGQARQEFTAKHKADMEAYKDKRYSGATGWLRWTGDLFMDLPAEANKIFDDAKKLYEQKMEAVISNVADLIGKELGAAKDKIAEGRQKIKEYVDSRPKNLQRFANEAANEMSGKFDQLESDVDSKQESLVEDLAQKYVEARNAVDEEIKAEQEKNKGLISKAKDAIGESIQAILKLKDLFMGLLSRAASAFGDIIKDPLKFIGNFMSAVKQGFMNFADNIVEHLKNGLKGWLFGQLADAGIEIPDKLDAVSILKMIASMLGLTWGNIKSKLVAKVPWLAKIEQAWEFLESKVEVFKMLATKGVAGLWDMLKEKVGDLKQMVFDQIKNFVIERIVKAGITWVLGMLNPAGALFKIVDAVIKVVQWIMEKGEQLGELIGSIIDAVKDIAAGGGGGVPAKIEGALSKAVPIVISFLASLLGLGGISEKIKSILQSAQEMVGKGIDAVIGAALKIAKPLLAAAGKLITKGKELWGKAKAKGQELWGKVKATGKGLLDKAKKKLGLADKKDDEESAASDVVRQAARSRVIADSASAENIEDVRNVLPGVLSELAPRGLKSLNLEGSSDEAVYAITAEASANKTIAVAVVPTLEKKADVRAHTTITYAQEPDVSGLTFAVKSKAKNIRGPATAYGGGLFVAPPEPGSKSLQMTGLSGGMLPGKRNESHAELHVADFMSHSNRQVKTPIASVNIIMRGKHSPCRNCVSSLVSAAELARGRSPSATFTIDCTKVKLYYEKGTGFESWAALKAAFGTIWTCITPDDLPKPKVKIKSKK